jgi:hypothetical protein
VNSQCVRLPYFLLPLFTECVEEEFSEVRGSKRSGVDAERGIGVEPSGVSGRRLARRWPHSWRGIVTSEHRLLHSNFLRILGTIPGFTQG